MSSEGQNIAIAIGFVLVVGLLIPQFMDFFYDISDIPLTGVYETLNKTINDGITFLGFDIDIFFFLGDSAKAFITDQIVGYNLFASELPLLADLLIIIVFIMSIYAILKALPTT